MIGIKTIEVFGFEGAIRGMRMPYESFNKSDSEWDSHCSLNAGYQNCEACPWEHMNCELAYYHIGKDDMTLCKKLIKGGSEHRKFLRMIHVQAEITAPRYWLTELDTYKIGTVRNSSSTMHLITKRLLTLDDFSHEEEDVEDLKQIIDILNRLITDYQTYSKRPDVENKKNKINGIFKRIKGILPESFMQNIVWDGNYETLMSIYYQRKNHRLEEWSGEKGFCKWIESLPYMDKFLDLEN